MVSSAPLERSRQAPHSAGKPRVDPSKSAILASRIESNGDHSKPELKVALLLDNGMSNIEEKSTASPTS